MHFFQPQPSETEINKEEKKGYYGYNILLAAL